MIKMKNQGSISSVNLGCGSLFGLLQIMFVGLKLADFIDWPWWQVLIPAIVWAVLVITILAVAAIGLACMWYKRRGQ